jgi:hypothetical protein
MIAAQSLQCGDSQYSSSSGLIAATPPRDHRSVEQRP